MGYLYQVGTFFQTAGSASMVSRTLVLAKGAEVSRLKVLKAQHLIVSKKYVISVEVFKYPYCGKSIESEKFLSEKICLATIRIRKKIVKKTKRVFIYGQLILALLGNELAPSQAIGLPILTTTSAIMRTIDSYTPKKVIIARVIESSPDKVIFTEKQMDQLYDFAVKCANGSMSKEELITELRGGGIEDWVGAFGIIIAIIIVINNVTGFQIPPNRGAIVHPNGAIVRPADGGKFPGPQHQKGGGRIKVRMSNSNQCPANAKQVSSFVKNCRLDLREAFNEVQRRASEIGCDNFNCSFERFRALATEGKLPTENSVREAIAALQGEMLGYYKDTVRGKYGKGISGPYFIVVGLGDYSHITHLEVKNPVGSRIEKASRGVSDLRLQGEKIGSKISKQQIKWSNTSFVENLPHVNRSESFPKSPENMLGLVDTF